MISYNERKPLTTELGRGSIRGEALDLLGYSYTETEPGKFSILGDLELVCERFPIEDLGSPADFYLKIEIEELVKLSYQALDRYSKERSKTVIKERGWGEAINAMNFMPGMYPNNSSTTPQYHPPMPESWKQNKPPYGEYTGHRPYTKYENLSPDKSAPSQAPLSFLPARKYPPVRRRARAALTSPPIEVERQGEEATKRTRPELRFALPRAQFASSTTDIAKEAQPSPAKSEVPASRTDDELQKARQRLEQVNKRKEEAEKARDLSTASDIIYYAIPDLKAQIEKLLKQQREEQEERVGPVSQTEVDKRSHHTEVETESEYSDDEGGSGALDLYD